MTLKTISPDNIVKPKNGKIIKIEKIFSSRDDDSTQEKITLKGLLYRSIIDVFRYPYKSSDVGLFQESLSKFKYIFQLEEIEYKCVLLKIKNITYCTCLLHT